jgi:hypothetical protein
MCRCWLQHQVKVSETRTLPKIPAALAVQIRWSLVRSSPAATCSSRSDTFVSLAVGDQYFCGEHQ